MNKAIHGYKLVLLGDSYVGKSSIMNKFAKNIFLENHETTIGAAFMAKTIVVNNRTIKFEIWDTAGQERYRSLAPVYYRGAEAAIVVYDVTNEHSFEMAKQWIRELHIKAESVQVIAIAGNKVDLAGKVVDSMEVNEYAKNERIIFSEVSAMSGHNIDQLFSTIASNLPARPDTEFDSITKAMENSFKRKTNPPTKKSCC